MKNIQARDIMTSQVITVHGDLPVFRLVEILTKQMISGVPVVDKDDELIGVVSLWDIVEGDARCNQEARKKSKTGFYSYDWRSELGQEEAQDIHYTSGMNVLVEDIMTSSVVTVEEDTPVVEIAQLMLDKRVHRVIVKKDVHVVGIITTMDMLKMFADGEWVRKKTCEKAASLW